MTGSKKRYDGKWKVTRIALGDYALLKEISQRAGISMAEALHKLITRQPEPKPEPKPEPAQLPMIPVLFKPKSIESNGAAPVKLKFIESAEDIRVKLKSIR